MDFYLGSSRRDASLLLYMIILVQHQGMYNYFGSFLFFRYFGGDGRYFGIVSIYLCDGSSSRQK